MGHAEAVLSQSRTEFVQVDAGLRLELVRALIAAHRFGRDVALTGEALIQPAHVAPHIPQRLVLDVNGPCGLARAGLQPAITTAGLAESHFCGSAWVRSHAAAVMLDGEHMTVEVGNPAPALNR